MPDAPPPRVRFLVADRDRGIGANTPAFDDLRRAEAEVEYWKRYVSASPCEIWRAETTYTLVEPAEQPTGRTR